MRDHLMRLIMRHICGAYYAPSYVDFYVVHVRPIEVDRTSSTLVHICAVHAQSIGVIARHLHDCASSNRHVMLSLLPCAICGYAHQCVPLMNFRKDL